jgi:hypothetical protein
MQLPPPDPYESLDSGPDSPAGLPAPIVVYAGGRPDPRVERTAESILDARPGALIVVVSR